MRTPGFVKRAPRIDLRKQAILINSDHEHIDVLLLDVSGSGFRLHVTDTLHIGEFVVLQVDGENVPAQIRWVLGEEAGGAFLAPPETPEIGRP